MTDPRSRGGRYAGPRSLSSTAGAWLGDRFRSTDELYARAGRLAAAFPSLGAHPGATVVVIARNSFLPLEVSFAAARAGVRVIPMSPHATGPETEFLLADSGATVVIGDADLLRGLRNRLGRARVVALETPAEVGEAFRVDPGSATVPDWVDDYEQVLVQAPPTPQAPAAMDISTTSLFYTSGTTGRPKGIVRPAIAPEEAAARREVLARCYGLHSGSRGIVPTPLCHMLGLNFATTTLALGGTLIIMPRFDPEDFLAAVERFAITSAPMVPTMFVRLLRLDEDVRSKYDVASLEHVLHTGAPISPRTKRDMIDWWGPILWEQYGCTETGVVALCDSQEWLAHPGTVGRPFLGSEIRVYDERGRVCPPGVPGMIYARMPGMPDFTYLNRPEERAAIEKDGLVTGGDVGQLDEEGYLYLVDRRSDLVISGGNNIYPAEIEAALDGHPEVVESAAFGVRDDEFGQRVVAAVVLEQGAGADPEELREWLRQRVAGYKVPKEILRVDELPRNDTGKLLRRRLRDDHEASAAKA